MAKLTILKISRLEALTDGIFAIAMTILVFNLNLPLKISDQNLWSALTQDVIEKLAIYAGSFIILGTQWIGVYFQFGFLVRVTRTYLWINIFCLLFLCVIPFSASLVADHSHNPVSISFYAINLILVTVGRFICWQYACKYKLNNPNHSVVAYRSIVQRLALAPVFYIAAPFVAYWDTHIAFLMLIAPPIIHIIPGQVDKYIEQGHKHE